MKKMCGMICILAVVFSLTACGKEFDGVRTGNDKEFMMEYTLLDTTGFQEIALEAGDRIDAEIVVDDGNLSIKIQKENERPVYESSGIFFSNEFTVNVEESGTYTISVTGKRAKGSVRFSCGKS